jgi:hypothetical protein
MSLTLDGNRPNVSQIVYDARSQRVTVYIGNNPDPDLSTEVVTIIQIKNQSELNYYWNAMADNIGEANMGTNHEVDANNNLLYLSIIKGGGAVNTKMLEGIVADDFVTNPYNGFPITFLGADGYEYTIFKKSATHADGQKMYITRTKDWINYESRAVTVGGVDTTCFALAGGKVGDYVHLLVNLLDDYAELTCMRILLTDIYNSFNTFNAVITDTIANELGQISVWNTKPAQRSSDNRIFIPFYDNDSPMTRTKNKLAYTDDNGLTWNIGATMRDSAEAGPVTGIMSLEPSIVITHDTGVTATTKMVCLSRIFVPPASGDFFVHSKSSDGGATWTVDQINFVYDFGNGTGAPVTMRNLAGVMYVIAGCRTSVPGGSYVGNVQYFTASPDDLYNNNGAGFSDVIKYPYVANANFQGGSIVDFGYPYDYLNEDGDEIWITFYDWYQAKVGDVGVRGVVVVRRKVFPLNRPL